MQGRRSQKQWSKHKQAGADTADSCLEVLSDHFLRVLLKEFTAWMGVAWLTPFKVPLHCKMLCFFQQCFHTFHMPNTQGGSVREKGSHSPAFKVVFPLPREDLEHFHTTKLSVIHTSNPQSQITEDRKSFPRDSPYSEEESWSESLGTWASMERKSCVMAFEFLLTQVTLGV